MSSFKLHVRTLAGATYAFNVSPSQQIRIVKQLLLNKIKHDKTQNLNINSSATIRLVYSDNNDAVELMDNKTISDYPFLSSNITLGLIIESITKLTINVLAPHGLMTIKIKPSDTVFDVKKQIYSELLDEPFYDDKTKDSAKFIIKSEQNGNWIKLLDGRTIASYPAIESNSTFEIVMDDEQYYADIYARLERRNYYDRLGSYPFNYLMSVSEFKNALLSKFDISTNEFDLYVGYYRSPERNKTILDNDAYLYEYPVIEEGVSICIVLTNENNNSNSNSNSNSNNNLLYKSNSNGGKRKHRTQRKTKRYTRKSRVSSKQKRNK